MRRVKPVALREFLRYILFLDGGGPLSSAEADFAFSFEFYGHTRVEYLSLTR